MAPLLKSSEKAALLNFDIGDFETIRAASSAAIRYNVALMCGRMDMSSINRLILNFDWADEVFNRSQAEGVVELIDAGHKPPVFADLF
jgi:hypothetical protein